MLRLLVQDGDVVHNAHASPADPSPDLNEVKGLLRVCQRILCYPEERYLFERSQDKYRSLVEWC